MSEIALVTKRVESHSRLRTKFFFLDRLSNSNESVEDAANKWLRSNAGNIKVYDVIYNHPATAFAGKGTWAIGIIYSKREPRRY